LIIVKLIGGLGNQMFQYAAARALALRRGAQLLLDITGFENYPKRKYCLHHFDLPAAMACPHHINRVIEPGWPLRFIDTILGRRRVIYRENAFTFDPEVLRLPDNSYLDGYWQSEKYFLDKSAAIRCDFSLPVPFIAQDSVWREHIRNTLAVSLHVRRGDYASEASIAAVHGTCAPEYYARASAAMVDLVGREPHFFIFSDDPTWAADNLHLKWPHSFVSKPAAPTDRTISEFAMMTGCKHHIIANSSFSWWAAWLCSNPEKIVIAPKRWFRSEERDDRDLIPPEWQRV
jgi:hypothetical protein